MGYNAWLVPHQALYGNEEDKKFIISKEGKII